MWPAGVELTPELRDLLEAQTDASEEFPYELLQVRRPRLSQIYVRQFVRRREVERREPDHKEDRKDPERREPKDSRETERREVTEETAVEETMTVAAALDANEHLLITGDAGAGKSTVGRVFCKTISDYWIHGGGTAPLREPVVPLRVPARSLIAQEAWSTALAQGVKEALGGRMLRTPPDPGLFAARALGVRWLVFVDGLDEIADEATTRQVVRAIARMAHRGTDYRLVITTRRLDEASMRVLTDARIATMNLEPFGQEQLVEFADSWFKAQDPIGGGHGQAREFVRQTADGQLRELVRNPLLATITAVTFTRHPTRPLPSNRVDLYGGFMASLLEEQASGRNIVGELRRVLDGRPARLRLAEWVGERRGELVRHLGLTRLESETPLLAAAVAWVTERQPDPPEGWERDLHAILAGSGVFVQHGDDLRFLHHSFAEFLAAQLYASTLTGDAADLGRWVERGGRRHASEVMMMFTLVLWGRRPGNDLESVVRRLLDGDLERIELAGTLLAEGAAIPDALADQVMARILNLVLLGEHQFGELLGSFDKRIAGQLYELVDREEVNVAARIECAIALGRLTGAEYGANKLESLGAVADADSLSRAVGGLTELVPDGAARAERLLLARLTPVPTTDVFPAAVEGLLDLGPTEATAAAVRELVRQARSEASTKVGWWSDPDDCETVARLALRCEDVESAGWAIRQVLANPGTDVRTLAAAVEILVGVSGADGIEEAVATRSAAHRVRVAARLSGVHPNLAEAVARSVLDDRSAQLSDIVDAAEELLSLGRLTAVEFRTLLEREPFLTGEHWLQMARALVEADSTDQGIDAAWRAIADATTDRWDMASAIELLLEHGVDPAKVRLTVEKQSPNHRIAAVEALCEKEHGDQAAALARTLVAQRIEEPNELARLVPYLVDAEESEVAGLVLATSESRVDRDSTFDMDKLAKAWLALDRRTDAAATARGAVRLDVSSLFPSGSTIENWLDAAGIPGADEVVVEMLAFPPQAAMRGTAAATLAERGFLTQATTLWLDILTNAGSQAEHRFEAASRLVATGRRERAIEALQEKLRHDNRTELRAMLGWVHLSDPTAAPNELIGMLHRPNAGRP